MPPKPFTTSVWTRPPRRRGEQPALSRDQIVRTAIELLDADGPAGLSMRRLGTRLGSGATSVYWYVSHKDELLELAVDHVMGEVYVPEATDTDWRTGASVFTHGMYTMLLRHPWVIGLLGVRPNMGPNALRNGDRMVALLSAAGFAGLELSHAGMLLTSHAVGSATTIAAMTNSSREAGIPVAELVSRIEPHLEMAAKDHPNYDRWRREIAPAAADPERVWAEGFGFGLERLLDGLEQWLSRRDHA